MGRITLGRNEWDCRRGRRAWAAATDPDFLTAIWRRDAPQQMTKPMRPRLASRYVRVYKPGPDCYYGPSIDGCVDGRRYEGWIPNDHTVTRGPDGRWHMFGITGPEGVGVLHGGEFQSFHIVSPESGVSPQEDSWLEEPKVLRPTDRPGEMPHFWAPCTIWRDGVCHMFFSPGEIRAAVSTDLYRWQPKGAVFAAGGMTRDPMVLEHDGGYIMYLCADSGLVTYWKSADLEEWSEGGVAYRHANERAACESPFVVRLEGLYYLFYTIYDGTNGYYDNRTFVHASTDPERFDDDGLVCELEAHAPEVFSDDEGDWYITSAEWPHRGVSLARLEWLGGG